MWLICGNFIWFALNHLELDSKLWKFLQKKIQIIDRVNGNSLITCSRGECIVVQSLSCVRFFVAPWIAACQPSLSFTISWSLLKLMYIESMMPSNHLMLCHSPLLLPSIFLSIRVFSNESALCIRWPKYWSFSFSISPSKNIQDWSPLGWTDLL